MGGAVALRQLGNLQILANLPGEVIADFGMPWDCGACVQFGMVPPRMSDAFAQQFASLLPQVPKQCVTLHTAMGASSKFPPAAPMASWRFSSALL
jgi:hypothetical protein